MVKYSIIITVYKTEAFLDKCISSVISQEGNHDFEIILVDCGLTDSGGLMCDGYAGMYPDIVHVIHQEDASSSSFYTSKNVGLEAASGEYVLFIDSSDIVCARMFNLFDQTLERFDADMLLFDYFLLGIGAKRVKCREAAIPAGRILYPQESKEAMLCMPDVRCKLFRRELFNENAIRFPVSDVCSELYVTLMMMATSDRILYVNEAICSHHTSNAISSDNENDSGDDEKLMRTLSLLKDDLAIDKVFCDYSNELAYLAADRLFIDKTMKAVHAAGNNAAACAQKYSKYMKDNFPGYTHNKYLKKMGIKKKAVLLLLRMKLYKAAALFKIDLK